jgi:hypothetical protein
MNFFRGLEVKVDPDLSKFQNAINVLYISFDVRPITLFRRADLDFMVCQDPGKCPEHSG